ncbi:hypothetical protein E4T44_10325 [Aureobasidium sp. EXF-8845]|nr:hypothetical protein E4T44_10325 [Aureobasidium sp. EXF-8845]
MAQVMAQRQEVATKTKLTQKQSTETVQVMLYTSACMLFRIRGIFPSIAFDTVEFAEDDELYNFEGLLNDEPPRRAQPSSPSSTSTRSSDSTSLNVPLLKRGRSVRVDQFLDSLHSRHYIEEHSHALRIPFMGNPEVESNSLELWSFRIIYKQSAEGEREVQSLETHLGNEDVYDPSTDLHGSVIGLLRRVLALRIASLKHEDSSTRRLSQDLRSRKPATNPADQSFSGTPTQSNEDLPMQPRTLSQTQSRRSTVTSAIPETPQRVVQFEGDQGFPADREAETSGIPEQPPPSSVSSASQLDDDIQRRDSLDNMLLPSSQREDNIETQLRRNASQILDKNGVDPGVTEHMENYDFLTSETAYRLWEVTCELQKGPNTTLVNTFNAVSAACNSTLSVKAI